MIKKQLLLQALNKNAVTFSNRPNTVRELSHGMMKVTLDPVNKSVLFMFGTRCIKIDFESMAIKNLEMNNDTHVDDILDALGELDEMVKQIEQKADNCHQHSISDKRH